MHFDLILRFLFNISSIIADSDELVVAVLRGVPSLARDRGVFGELALRERFTKVNLNMHYIL